MARVTWQKNTDGERKRFLMIDHSVGRTGSNRRDDVMLIQFMLNEVSRPGAHLMKEGHYSGHEPIALKVDGFCGPLTIGAILAFQKAKNASAGFKMVPETGSIRARMDGTRSTPKAFVFNTLYILNGEFFLSLAYRRIHLESALKGFPVAQLLRSMF